MKTTPKVIQMVRIKKNDMIRLKIDKLTGPVQIEIDPKLIQKNSKEHACSEKLLNDLLVACSEQMQKYDAKILKEISKILHHSNIQLKESHFDETQIDLIVLPRGRHLKLEVVE